MSVKKYFIAIVIPAPLQEKAEQIKKNLFTEYGLKGALRSPTHITLHRPFEWKEKKEAGLIELLSDFKLEQPFTITVKDFAFFEPRVIYVDVLPSPELLELYKRFVIFAKRELKLFNEAEDTRGFHPHLTVAFRDLKKPLFYKLQSEFEKKEFKGSFTCNGFSLLKFGKKWEELFFFGNKG